MLGKILNITSLQNPIIKDLTKIIRSNNKSPSDILRTDLDFLKTIGLDQHLSVTRKNGLSSMIDRIKLEAKKNK